MRNYRSNSHSKYGLKAHLNLKGGSSRILLQEYVSLRKQFWGRYLWKRWYMAISLGNITHELIQRYIEEKEGEPMEIGQFQIDSML